MVAVHWWVGGVWLPRRAPRSRRACRGMHAAGGEKPREGRGRGAGRVRGRSGGCKGVQGAVRPAYARARGRTCGQGLEGGLDVHGACVTLPPVVWGFAQGQACSAGSAYQPPPGQPPELPRPACAVLPPGCSCGWWAAGCCGCRWRRCCWDPTPTSAGPPQPRVRPRRPLRLCARIDLGPACIRM
jgi:hypothetical protein